MAALDSRHRCHQRPEKKTHPHLCFDERSVGETTTTQRSAERGRKVQTRHSGGDQTLSITLEMQSVGTSWMSCLERERRAGGGHNQRCCSPSKTAARASCRANLATAAASLQTLEQHCSNYQQFSSIRRIRRIRRIKHFAFLCLFYIFFLQSMFWKGFKLTL